VSAYHRIFAVISGFCQKLVQTLPGRDHCFIGRVAMDIPE
jgi:hypothetical protein